MRSRTNFSWTLACSGALHGGFAAYMMLRRPSLPTPPPVRHVVHMHLAPIEHHAAPKAAVVAVAAVAATPAAAPAPKPAPPSPQAPKPRSVAVKAPTPPPVAVKAPTPPPPPKLAQAPAPPAAPTPAPAAAPPSPTPAALPAQRLAAKAPPAAKSAAASEAARGEDGDGADSDDSGEQGRDAMLLRDTLEKPEYTSEALFARLEGVFPMNVKIDGEGHVLKAELAKKVGYGMDQRILSAVLKARFQPGRDAHGQVVAGWVKLKFKLEIPD